MSVLYEVRQPPTSIGNVRVYPVPVAPKQARGPWDMLPWAGAVVLSIATLLLLFGQQFIPMLFQPAVPFELQASEAAGQMYIRWNTSSDGVAKADGAVLEVKDGTRNVRYPVSQNVLANGSVQYIRKSDDVVASLVLYKEGRELERRIVRSVSAPGGKSGLTALP